MRLLLNLILHLMVVLLLMMMLSRATSSVDEITQALPRCPNKCGNVTIPYPIGTKKNCYLNKLYYVDCKKLQIWHTTFKVQEISNDGYMRGLLPAAYSCYNERHEIITNTSSVLINLSRFRLSDELNVLTTVGCDATASIQILPSQEYITGCSSTTDCKNVYDNACEGTGCSHVSISYGMKNFRIHTSRATDIVGKWRYDNCTYGFIVEKGRYNFTRRDFGTMHERTPVVLKWSVGDMISCETAKKTNSSYLCQENSVCINVLDGSKTRHFGYRCQCAQGYKGNAYLPNGCKDIDECAGQNECGYGCVNTKGGYNCSCPSGQQGDGRRNGTGCIYAVTAVTSLSPGGGNISKIQYQGISMGIAASLVFTLILYCGLRQRNIIKSREMLFKKNGGLILQRLLFEAKQSNHIAKIFSARALEKATDNFHKSNVIGEGGYGTVYKGTLEDKITVAIKTSKSIDKNQIEQFINEVIILSEISHPNVVKLLGCCLETHTPVLVYEFVTNKTVFNHLHEHDNRFFSSLPFERRLNIATQTAEALAYIHSTTQIIHRDIKSSNILLTDDYTAKVSDFGISKFIPIDQSHVHTLVHGTLGYIDPEYFRSGILTEKSDVYSFGMFLVELLTGRKVFSHDGTESDLGLAMFFVSSLERGSLIQILDDQVKLNGLNEHIKLVANLAKDCIELEGKKRPNMEEVKTKLEELRKSFLQCCSITDPDQLLHFYT